MNSEAVKHSRVLFWIPRVSGTLSFLGSSAIIFINLSDRKRKLARSKNRFMLLMSIFDIFQSTAMVVSVSALPREMGIYGAIGNEATCRAQMFFLLLGMAVPLYNVSLNLLYLLSIRYNMSPRQFSHKIEPYLHGLSIIIPLVLSMLSVLNPNSKGRCLASSTTDMRLLHIIIIVYFCFCLVFTLFSMIFIILTVNSQEKAVRKYNFRSSRRNGNNVLQKKGMITQALLYMLAFLLTFIFPFARSICSVGKERGETVLDILTVIFYPLQGFWNFVIYIRPGIKHVRKMNPEKSLYRATIQVIFDTKSVADSLGRQSMRQTLRHSVLRRSSIRIPPLCEEEESGSSLLRENDSATRRGSLSGLVFQEEHKPKVAQKRVSIATLVSLPSDCSYWDIDGEELDDNDRKGKITSHVSISSHLSEESLDDLGQESLDQNDIEGGQTQIELNHTHPGNEEWNAKDRKDHYSSTNGVQCTEKIKSLLSISSYSEGPLDDLGGE